MGTNQIFGIVLLIAGPLMLYLGYVATQSVGEQLQETFTRRFSDSTTWYFVAGVVVAVVGVGLLAFKR